MPSEKVTAETSDLSEDPTADVSRDDASVERVEVKGQSSNEPSPLVDVQRRGNPQAALTRDPATLHHRAVAALLTASVRSSEGADLMLFGRQASDDDQGVVFALIGEALDMPIVTVARALELVDASDGPALRVTRVTPNGDEVVEVSCPAVVTVSNELGDPRYPTAAKKLAARRKKPTVLAVDDLSLSAEQLQPRATLTRQFVPTIQGNCEFISGDTSAALADSLIERLREDGTIQ